MSNNKSIKAFNLFGWFVLTAGIGWTISLVACFLIWERGSLYSDQVTWGILNLKYSLSSGLGFLVASIGVILTTIIFAKIALNENEPMEHVIYPFPMKLTMEDILAKNSRKVFLRVDDEFLIINNGNPKYPLYLGAFFSFITGFLIFPNLFKGEMTDEAGFFFPIFLGAFISFIYGIFYPKKHFIFNRMKGTVTMPGPFFFPSCTIPFEKLKIGNFRDSLTFIHPFTRVGVMVYGEYCVADWSFYVLYMDRNRPLPQGTAFDPYREKDFKRRQKEGFPKPLYPNEVWVCDAYMGYIYGTDEFKVKLKTFKVNIVQAYDSIFNLITSYKFHIPNENNLVPIGIWLDYYVFRLFAPENQEYFVFADNDEPDNCFLVHGQTKKLKYIPSQKDTSTIEGTPEFFSQISALKFNISEAYNRLMAYLAENGNYQHDASNLALMGVSDRYYVFCIGEAQPSPCIVLEKTEIPSIAYLVQGNTRQVIPPNVQTETNT